MKRLRSPGATARARRLRRSPTSGERAAWRALRLLRDEGLRIRRQHPIGSYTVDFVVLSRKLIIEVDGRVHEIFGRDEAARDAWLKSEDYRVLRVPNEIAFDADRFMALVRQALGQAL